MATRWKYIVGVSLEAVVVTLEAVVSQEAVVISLEEDIISLEAVPAFDNSAIMRLDI